MNTDRDFALALQLQEQFNKKRVNVSTTSQPDTPNKNLADPNLEYKDPTPNVHELFVNFNRVYFWSKLNSVAVRWSKRMYSCAGICSYHPRNGLCDIALSEPLLKLRPRKDLVETLLHEMIHAYLFITNNDRDRDGHGPNFLSHMHRINKATNLNISVYHSFHDEVRLYQTHWWRCDGRCRSQKPYYGFVKRSSNRAPGPNDFWWKHHTFVCGGTFIKVKEPEKKQKKNSAVKQTPSNVRTLDDMLHSGKENNLNKTNKSVKNTPTYNTIVPPAKTPSDRKSTSASGGNHKSTPTNNRHSTGSILPFVSKVGKNQTMSSSTATVSGGSRLSSDSSDSKPVLEAVRDSWLKKFSVNANQNNNKRPSDTELYSGKSNKVMKLETVDASPMKAVPSLSTVKVEADTSCDIKNNSSFSKNNVNDDCKPSTSSLASNDDSLSLFYSIPPRLLDDFNQIMRPLYGDTFTLNEGHFKSAHPRSDMWEKAANIEAKISVPCPVCNNSFPRSQIEVHVDMCLESGPSTSATSSNYIDLSQPRDIKPKIKHDPDFVIDLTDADTSFRDEKPIKQENHVQSSGEDVEAVQDSDEIIDSDHCHCPLCNKLLHRDEADQHLEECVSMTFVNESTTEFASDMNDNEDIDEPAEEESEDSTKVSCPSCYMLFEESEINSHLDDCLL